VWRASLLDFSSSPLSSFEVCRVHAAPNNKNNRAETELFLNFVPNPFLFQKLAIKKSPDLIITKKEKAGSAFALVWYLLGFWDRTLFHSSLIQQHHSTIVRKGE